MLALHRSVILTGKSSVIRASVAATLCLALAGCSGSTSPDLDDRSAGDLAVAVSTAVSRGFAVALDDGGRPGAVVAPARPSSAGGSPPAGAEQFAWSFDGTGDCPAGGTVRARGDGSVESSERQGGGRDLAWDWQAGLGYDRCGVFAADGTYFLTADPELTFDGQGHAVTDGQGPVQGSFEWSYGGDVTWVRQGGPTGTCQLSLSTTLTFQGGSAQSSWTGTVEGTVCGRQVSRGWRTTIQP